MKKKILVFYPSFIQKSQSFIADNLDELSKYYELHIYTFNTYHRNHIFLLNIKNIIYDNRFSILYCKEKYPYIDAYSDNERKIYIYFIESLRKYIQKESINTIFCEFLSDAAFIHTLKEKTPHISIISNCRGRDIYCEYSLLAESQRKGVLQNIDLFLLRDASMKKRAFEYNFPKGKIKISHTGKKNDTYHFTEKKFSYISILFGGRLVEKKGILETIDFLEKLGEGRNMIVKKIVMLGDFESSNPYSIKVQQRLYSSPYLSKHVICLGFLNQNSYLKLIHEDVNVFIGHYKTAKDGDQDGIPNLLLENMLVGNLCFSTLSGGISEILEDTVTGYTFEGDPKKDVEKFKAKILMDNKEILINAQKSIIERFSITNEIETIRQYLG